MLWFVIAASNGIFAGAHSCKCDGFFDGKICFDDKRGVQNSLFIYTPESNKKVTVTECIAANEFICGRMPELLL